jgi:hypothetical protein
MNPNGHARQHVLQIVLLQYADGTEQTQVQGPIGNAPLALRMLEEARLLVTEQWLKQRGRTADAAPLVVGVRGTLPPPGP